MADSESNQSTESTGGGGGARTAAKAAAAAALTGAAAMAVQKAITSGSSGKSTNGSNGSESEGKGQSGGLLNSMASGGWDAARDALVPIAEDAASAAGKYLAKNGPELVTDKLVPKFIEAFNDAREED